MKKISILVPVILLMPVACFGGSKAGTATAQFLKISVGARAVGMGEAFVAISNDALALYWNPAGLVNSEKVNFTATHTQWFADLAHGFTGVVVPFGDNALGLGATFLNSGEIEITTLQEQDGTGIYYSASDLAIGLSYSRMLTDRFSAGITGKFIQQSIYHESATGFGVDVGTLLLTGFHGLKIGMTLSNFGTEMKLDGRDLIVPYNPGGDIAITPDVQAKQSTEAWPLPMNFRVGIAMDIIGGPDPFFPSKVSRLTLAMDGIHPTDNVERGNMGAEYAWNEKFFARIGYKYNYDEEGLTCGCGFKPVIGQARMSIDYAVADFGILGLVHCFTMSFVL